MKVFENKWPAEDSTAYLQLLAEQIIELVEDYAWSSYRAKATSTPFKAAELHALATQVVNGEINRPTLSHSLDEYIDAVNNDLCVRDLCKALKLSVELFVPLNNASENKIIIKTRMFGDVIASKYKKHCKDKIIDLCFEKKSKNDLRSYVQLYIPALINGGVSRQWIHKATLERYYENDVLECSRESLVEFLDQFDAQPRRFQVFFITNKTFAGHLRDRQLGATIFDNYEDVPEKFKQLLAKLPKPKGKSFYVLMPEHKDINAFAVAKSFEQIISLLSSLLYLVDNGAKSFAPRAMLCDDLDRDAVTFVWANDSFHPGRVRPFEGEGVSSINDSLGKYALDASMKRGREANQRLFSSLSAVSLAAKTHQPDARLLAMWAGFEGLLTSPKNGDQPVARIVHFEGLITPCVAYDYIARTFSEFRQDCLKLSRSSIDELLERQFSDSSLTGFCRIFFADAGVQKEFCSLISKSPLLLSRAHELNVLANTPQKIVALQKAHEARIRWQINRIYRERNAIVHKASRTTVVQNLSEHAYSYFRNVILALEAAYVRFGVIDTDAALELIKYRYKEYCKKLHDEASAAKNGDASGVIMFAVSNRLSAY